MALTFEEARLRLAVSEERAAARAMFVSITDGVSDGSDALTVVLRYILNHTEVRERIDDLAVEIELIKLAKEGDEDALLRLMFAYAEKLRGLAGDYRRSVRSDELIEALATAIVDSLVEYNPEKGTPLVSTLKLFGRPTMQSMLNPGTRLYGFTMEVRELRRYWAILNEGAARFEAENGREPLSYDETYPYACAVAAERVKIDPKHAMRVSTFVAIFSLHSPRVQLDSPLAPNSTDGDDSAATLSDKLAAPTQPGIGPDDAFRTALVARLMREELDDRETEVVRYAYGFPPESYGSMTDPEVTEALKDTRGYSRRTVSRIHKSALDKMRAALDVEVD